MKVRLLSRSTSDYRPVSPRRRLLIVLLAVAMAVTVMWLLLERPGAVFPPRPSAAPPGPCADGRGTGCVGGVTQVLRVQPQPQPDSTAASSAR